MNQNGAGWLKKHIVLTFPGPQGVATDRKRKKFVSNQQEQDKRIKTESGNWIKESFKTGKYEEYKQKAKTGLDDAGSDDDGNESNRSEIQFLGSGLFKSEIE